MLISMSFVGQSLKRITNIVKTYERALKNETKISEEAMQDSIIREVINIRMGLAESNHFDGSFYEEAKLSARVAWNHIKEDIRGENKKIDLKKTIIDLQNIIGTIDEKSLDGWSRYSHKSDYIDHWLNGRSRCMPYMDLEMITKAIKCSRPYSLLDTNVGDGSSVFKMMEKDDRIEPYGVCLSSESRVNREDRKRFRRYIIGGLRGATITNNAFDVAIVRPQLQVTQNLLSSLHREEKTLIQKTMDYVRPGGAMIVAMPYFRFYDDMCAYLGKNLENVQVFTSNAAQISFSNMMYIVGTKREKRLRDADEKIYSMLRNLGEQSVLDKRTDELGPIVLPFQPLPINTFRGGIIEDEEFDRMFDSSGATIAYERSQKVEKISDHARRPLLPFSVGQLGLVLTSGCLDGIVEEDSEHSHVVKGRVIKDTTTSRNFSEDNSSVEVTNLTTNRVEIKAFLPDGTYRSLA